MDNLKKNILNCLKDLKGSGKFISSHTVEFQFPGLEVNGVGEIAYPITETQAKALIKVAKKAPFGKGSETIIDPAVRSSCEIDAAELTFNGNNWTAFLDKVINKIKPDLGLEDYTISAHLYKMLIYETGDFFLPHKDSEKEKGMFGSLVVSLPFEHTGGELVVSFEGVEKVVAFADESGNYKIGYAAFYADCDHEIKPLTSGYRICLVYNLVQQKSGKAIQLTSVETYAQRLSEIFAKEQSLGHTKPHIVLLGHQYTPENFSIHGLKLNDRPKAEALLSAAKKAGCYAKLCLVTSYLEGAPENGGGYDGYDDEYGEELDEDIEMDEVYDESLYIEHWLKNEIPQLNSVSFEESDLIASFAFDDDEPIIKESTGYMGNYGPDVMHWYHYGAIMIWTPVVNAQLLLQQDPLHKLEWIGHFNKNIQSISEDEVASVNYILRAGLTDVQLDQNTNFNVIIDWLINRGNKSFFEGLNPELCQFYFTKIDADHWLKFAQFFPAEITEKILERVTQSVSLQVLDQLLSVLRVFVNVEVLYQILVTQIKQLPRYFVQLPKNAARKEFPANRAILDDFFWIEKELPQDKEWVNRMSEILIANPHRDYINNILVPQLMLLNDRTELTQILLLKSREFLQSRVNSQPQPPENWYRKMPFTKDYKSEWQILKMFLESPDQQVFDYRKKQSERTALENAIRNVVIDLKTETIKKGTPHTLRITKTQQAYGKEMEKWNEDVKLLNKIVM